MTAIDVRIARAERAEEILRDPIFQGAVKAVVDRYEAEAEEVEKAVVASIVGNFFSWRLLKRRRERLLRAYLKAELAPRVMDDIIRTMQEGQYAVAEMSEPDDLI